MSGPGDDTDLVGLTKSRRKRGNLNLRTGSELLQKVRTRAALTER